MSITLYFAPNSSAFAPLVALEEAGADFDAELVSLAEGEQHLPRYRAINPRGRVPTLIVDGTALVEVIAILGWIADRYPDAGLLPIDPVARAQAFGWMGWIASTVHVALAQVRRPERHADDPALRRALEAPGRTRFAAALAELESFSASTPSAFLSGDRFGILDAYALVVRRWADGLQLPRETFAHFTDRTDTLFARPAVRRAVDRENRIPATNAVSAA